MFPEVFWMVSKVFCTSSSLETSQLRAIWSSRSQMQNVWENNWFKVFYFSQKSKNEIMTKELCSSHANSLFWLLNSIGTAVNQFFLRIHKWSNRGFPTKDLIKGKMSFLHLPPCREATAVRAASLLLETTASLQPLWASWWDTAFPMPLEPPNTTASLDMTLPGELIMSREITWLM